MGRIFCFPVFSRKSKIKLPSPKETFSDWSTSPGVGPEAGDSYLRVMEDASSSEQPRVTNAEESSSNSLEQNEACYENENVLLKAILNESEHLSDPGVYGAADSYATSERNPTSRSEFEEDAPSDFHGEQTHSLAEEAALDLGPGNEAKAVTDIHPEVRTAELFSNIDGDTASCMRRVEEWVNSIELEAPLVETSPEVDKASKYSEEPAAKQRSMELAQNVARALDIHSRGAHLSGIGLTVIPSLGAFSQLEVLKLSANSIAKIPLGRLPKSLRFLDLSRNKITAIEGLRELTRLRILNLSHNRISRIGQGLSNCSSLRELYLVGNKISEVEGLHRLTKLACIDLSLNRLATTKSLEQLAANYTSLVSIDLAGNPVVANIGEEHLKRLVTGLAPNLVYLNGRRVNKGAKGSKSSRDSLLPRPQNGGGNNNRQKRATSSTTLSGPSHHHHNQQQQQQHHKRHGGASNVKAAAAPTADASAGPSILRVRSADALYEE